MATKLGPIVGKGGKVRSGVVSRRIEIGGREWIIALVPATPESRFDAIAFRPLGCRKGGPSEYSVPMESVRNFAAEKTRLARIAERKRIKKEKKFGA